MLFMGKSTICLWAIFNSKLLVYQRVPVTITGDIPTESSTYFFWGYKLKYQFFSGYSIDNWGITHSITLPSMKAMARGPNGNW